VAVRCADFVFVLGSVNVNKTVAGVCIVFFDSIKPQNPGRNEIFGFGQRIVGAKRHSRLENRSRFGVMTDFFRDAKLSERRFETAKFGSEPKARAGDRKRSNQFTVASQRQLLIGNRDIDPGLRSLHHVPAALQLRRVKRSPDCRAYVSDAKLGGAVSQRRPTISGIHTGMMKKNYHIVIVGATGAVGQEFLRVLERRNFPIASLRALSSARSAGKRVLFRDESIVVEELTKNSFNKIDIAFFSAGGDVSQKFAPIARDAGAVVVDNSSAFRMDPDVPLVIPEINGADVKNHRGIIANPNCTTAVALMAIYPLHRILGVKRVFAASYQAVSGSGARAIAELKEQVEAAVRSDDAGPGSPIPATVYPHPIAFNVLPHVDVFLENGYTKEEMKFQNEGRKIMHLPDFRASVTCVRVPVYRAHSVAVSAEFEKKISVEQAREVLAKAPGLELVDEPHSNRYPMPLTVAGKDNCEVGRVRLDCAFENGLAFWVSGDQLLKGAALNAVQIAELL
jgi:aspartate-semialdehyde dehydrogenase